jgi:hypothetical protein
VFSVFEKAVARALKSQADIAEAWAYRRQGTVAKHAHVYRAVHRLSRGLANVFKARWMR